jgi:hypothetical protein
MHEPLGILELRDTTKLAVPQNSLWYLCGSHRDIANEPRLAKPRRGMFSLIEVMLSRRSISDTLARFVRGFFELRTRLER